MLKNEFHKLHPGDISFLHKLNIMQESFMDAPSHWEMTLQCNVVSHWLGARKKNDTWSCISLLTSLLPLTHVSVVVVVRCLHVHHWRPVGPGFPPAPVVTFQSSSQRRTCTSPCRHVLHLHSLMCQILAPLATKMKNSISETESWEIWMKLWRSNFQAYFSDWCPHVIVAGLQWWWVNTGSGNGLVPSGNKLLPEQMLIQLYVTIWCH